MVGHKSILHNTKANCISIFCGYKLTKIYAILQIQIKITLISYSGTHLLACLLPPLLGQIRSVVKMECLRVPRAIIANK